MTPRQFYDTVVEMRRWQKAYYAEKEFNDAKKYALNKSRQYERAVDMEIERVERILNGTPQPKQTSIQFAD